MKTLTYQSLSETSVEWHSYFKDRSPSITNDYDLACYIEKSLFKFGVERTSVLVVLDDQDTVKGILPISYESEKGWSYWPSYMFISVIPTIDSDVWPTLPEIVPRPFRIYETSFKTDVDLYLPSVAMSPANVIDLSPYDSLSAYLNDLDKKTRSKFRNCLNRNQDILVSPVTIYKDDSSSMAVRESYMTYCAERFEGTEDLSYFQNQLSIFPNLFHVAEQHRQLTVLELRLDGRLVAINYSVIDGNCLYDYICYRETDEDLEKRSLGIFAILKNIERMLLQNKVGQEAYYDLASEFSYKKQFLPEIRFQQVTMTLT